MKLRFISSLLLIVLPLIAGAQSSKKYKVYDTYLGWEVGFEDMMKDIKNAMVVLIGEEHNDSMAHVFQLDVLTSLAELKGADQIYFSMEMFERDVQSIMDEYLKGYISEKNFIKESRSWGNYKDYRPMVEFCKSYNIPIICANTPARYVNMVTRDGLNSLKKLPASTKHKFLPPLPIDTLKGAYAEKFWRIMGDPAHVSPQMRYLYQSQNLWDATMAYSILSTLDYNPRHTVLHINGRFHSDHYLGLAQRIKRHLKKGGQLITITCIPASEYNPQEHQSIADFVILTQ